MTDSRFVTFQANQPPLSVTAILGTTPPVPSDGYGGWNLVTRPRRKALTEWGGINPLRVLVTVILGVKPGRSGQILDGYALGTSCETDRTTLERMAQPPSPGSEPPLVTVHGAVPHANDGPWVIESFDWDQNPIIAGGKLARQEVTVHLLEYVRDDRLVDLNAAQTARLQASIASATAARTAGGTSNQTPHQKTYVVKSGDTLVKIAASVLGNYKRWGEIATLNHLTDPDTLTVGERLRIP